MTLMRYYSMNGKNSKKWAVARTEKGFDRYGLWDLIETLNTPDQWKQLQFVLGNGELTDLPPTDVIGRVCSPKLADAIRPFDPGIMWLPVYLRRDDTEYTYYFMHFTSVPDVLDEDKTVYAGGAILTPHLSLAKVSQFPLFCLRPLGKSTFVREDVKKAIEKAGCTGIEFETVAAS